MRIPEIEYHDFMGSYTKSSRRRQLEEYRQQLRLRKYSEERQLRLRKHLEEIDVPILCVPELLEENISKIKEWYKQGGKIKCYSSISPFKDGLAVVKLPDFNETNSGEITEIIKTGLIDENGTEIMKCEPFRPNIYVLNKNLLLAHYGGGYDTIFSVKTGKPLISEPLYYVDDEFNDGLLVTLANPKRLERDKPQTNKFVYYDENGEIALTSEEFASMGEFKNGLALVTKEECHSGWKNNHEVYNYKCKKFFINKKCEIVREFGIPLWKTPYERERGGQIFSADKYYQFNTWLPENLRFEEPVNATSSAHQSTDEIREQILKGSYNPEQEIQKTVDRITYLTNNWGTKYRGDFDENGQLIEIEEATPYIYYLNRDSYKLDEDYTPAKQMHFKKQ